MLRFKSYCWAGLFFVGALLSGQQEKVVLTTVRFEVEGVYNRAALLNFLHLREGQEFDDVVALDRYVEREVNHLEGVGYYRDIHYSLTPTVTPGEYALRVSMEANWTIYPLPIPVYDSNTGPGFRGRLLWDNFLGSMMRAQLRFDMDSQRDSPHNDWTAGVSISGLQLSDVLSASFGISHNYDAEGLVENQETTGSYAMTLTLPRLADDVGLSYNAGLSGGAKYGFRNFDTGSTDGVDESEVSLELGHGPMVDSVRYQDGLKQGFTASLRNVVSARISGHSGVDELTLGLDFRAYQPYFDMLNFRGRMLLMGSRNIVDGEGSLDSTDYLRGVSDAYSRSGSLGVVLNMDALLRVWRNVYLGEIYLEPFLDLGIIGGLRNFGSIEEVLQLSTGLDISWKINSLVMRFSLGKNLFVNDDIEITLGTGLFF